MMRAVNIAGKSMSTADIGGRRVLNMGGSLSGYINTGNPYHKDYFARSKRGKLNIENNKVKTQRILKVFSGFIIASLGAAACIFGGKKITGKLPDVSKIFKKTSQKAAPAKSAAESSASTKKASDFVREKCKKFTNIFKKTPASSETKGVKKVIKKFI